MPKLRSSWSIAEHGRQETRKRRLACRFSGLVTGMRMALIQSCRTTVAGGRCPLALSTPRQQGVPARHVPAGSMAHPDIMRPLAAKPPRTSRSLGILGSFLLVRTVARIET